MTILRQTPDDYMFNLEALTPAESKRLWRERIKENWNYECAYCGSDEDITLDHIKPRSQGGEDKSVNVLCACHECNQSKGHTEWREWYGQQMFYSWERMKSIEAWMTPVGDTGRYNAFKRKNVCYATAA
jgi:hypothetical protein